MQALLLQIVGGLVRMALGGAIAMLVSNGVITEGQVPQLVGGIALALISGGWIAWNKVKERQKLHTALALPPGFTVEQLKEFIAQGKKASALTPEDRLPAVSFPTTDQTKRD